MSKQKRDMERADQGNKLKRNESKTKKKDTDDKLETLLAEDKSE